MANKRMFSVDVVETDSFLNLPLKSQALYFHLGLHGDDDGFVSNPKSIMRIIGCTNRDLKPLKDAGYVILFRSGVLVIADWKINNTLKNDRYHKTMFREEFSSLKESSSKRYILQSNGASNDGQAGTSLEPNWNQNGNQMEPEHNVTEQNIAKPTVAEQQRPTAPPAAVAPHKGALGGMTALGSSIEETGRDAATEAARQKFLNSIKRPAWAADDAAPPDAEKKE